MKQELAVTLSFWVAVALCACEKKQESSGAPSASASASPPSPLAGLPAKCRRVAAQFTCWLRASGNREDDVETAIANGRDVLSAMSNDDRVRHCEQAEKALAERFAAASCTAPDLSPAKPGTAPRCAAGEFFAIRDDGRVSGCRRECVTDSDCNNVERCSSRGYGIGGPTDQPFCDKR